MINNHSVWMQDLLGEVKRNPTQANIKLMESCGRRCAEHRGEMEGIKELKNAAAHCQTREDYADFLNKLLPDPVNVEAVHDGIIMKLGKDDCTCPMASEITENGEALCYCTQGHEKAVWSEFFNKSVEVEMIETILRGGNDCVVKIVI